MGILSDDPAFVATRQWAERVSRFRSEIEASLGALEAPLATPASDAPSHDAFALKAVRRVLNAGPTGDQREILRAVLDGAALCFPRTILLIGRDQALVAWERRGFGDEGPATAVRLSAGGDHLPGRARGAAGLQVAGSEGPGDEMVRALGGGLPATSAAAPLMVRDRIVAVLYGDAASPLTAESLELFEVLAQCGGLALEIRRSRLRAAAERTGALLPARAPDRHARPGGLEINPAEPEEAEMQALLGDLETLPRRDEGDGLSPEEQRQHNDARRFASLLVSELLLYNEEAVIQGRKQRDLSRRLAQEIERTRRTYDARISSSLRGGPRYLEDELLRVLADGDEALLTV